MNLVVQQASPHHVGEMKKTLENASMNPRGNSITCSNSITMNLS
jgi:hypothetical protein